MARTGKDIVAREIFDRFKTFADHQAGVVMVNLLLQVHDASQVYRKIVVAAAAHAGPINRLGLFVYRTGVLESEVVKPLLLWLLDPEQPPISQSQLTKVLEIVESSMVRRMLVRATTKNYTQVIVELIARIRNSDRESPGDVIEKYLAAQKSASSYWPDDAEVAEELQGLLAYRRLRRGRLRMVMEAIEDHLRGWKADKTGLGGERVARGQYAIEHVMPRRWVLNWPLDGGNEADRDRLIHTLGNLTLLTGKLNSKVSNGPWLGNDGKRRGLEAHDVLLLNRELLKKATDRWSDESIRFRSRELTEIVIQIWPVPDGHRSDYLRDKPTLRKKIHLSDLIAAGAIEPGISLFPRRKKFIDRVVTLLPDGRIEVDGSSFTSPSDAASAMTGHHTNGWWFFLVDQASRRSLRSVRRDYINQLAVDVEDDEAEDDGDED